VIPRRPGWRLDPRQMAIKIRIANPYGSVRNDLSTTVKVITEGNTGRIVEIDAPPGSALVDLCDEHLAPIPFNCRSASCGTCRIHVLEGADQLLPPKEDELDLLDVFNHKPPLIRLTCQAKLAEGATRVHVKAFQEE
jgi:ferredoxin